MCSQKKRYITSSLTMSHSSKVSTGRHENLVKLSINIALVPSKGTLYMHLLPDTGKGFLRQSSTTCQMVLKAFGLLRGPLAVGPLDLCARKKNIIFHAKPNKTYPQPNCEIERFKSICCVMVQPTLRTKSLLPDRLLEPQSPRDVAATSFFFTYYLH